MKLYLQALLIVMIVFCGGILHSQSSKVTRNYDLYHMLDRYEILYGGEPYMHTSTKDYYRSNMVRFVSQKRTYNNFSGLDEANASYIYKDNNDNLVEIFTPEQIEKQNRELYKKQWIDSIPPFYTIEELEKRKDINSSGMYYTNEKPLFNTFYKTPANFWEVETEDFYMKINPVIHFKGGEAIGDENIVFKNTRGFEIRGAIDDKVYFYTNLYETQQRFNNYIEHKIDQFQSIPGNGFFKPYDSAVIDNFGGWDFLNAEAYVGFNISKSVGMEFGHGSHFIGNGYHSLLLGNYAHNYFYLKFNTQFWKLKYQNIFAELSGFGQGGTRGNQLLPKKYMAAHYLDFNITDDISIGLFEAVVFSRFNNFEFQYLNPVIIYRTVEGFLDSPDNVLIGLNGKWNIKRKFQLYSQLILDEFKFEQLSQGTGWWANKYGFQLGAKYMNVAGIDHLDGQVEYNIARPYIYAHRDTVDAVGNLSTASYSHYSQPLAHPLGSNFREIVLRLRYQPIPKLVVEGRLIRTDWGDDASADENYGGDILKSFDTRVMDFNNEIAQGVGTQITLLGFDASYQFYHNMFAELHFLYRKSDADLDAADIDTKYIGAGLRINIANQRLDY